MNGDTEISKLLNRFAKNNCSEAEVQQIITYLQKTQQSDTLPEVEEVLASLSEPPVLESDKANTIFLNILRQSEQITRRSRLKTVGKYAAIAAVFAGVITLGIFFQKNWHTTSDELVPARESVTLELDNGMIKTIGEEGTANILDAEGNVVGRQEGKELLYPGQNEAPQKLVYNTLTVPYGKKYGLRLSDGTKVYLNSGTSLRYPVSFIKGKERQVFLNGEAFFEVTTDTVHPFIVNAEKLNVQVLGTEFTVSNYPEDIQTDVVLVEGSVGMYKEGDMFNKTKDIVLTPGLKGSFNKSNGDIQTREVITSVYTSWVYGELVFRNMTFNNILKKLERHYNIRIINTNTELGEEEFNASFGNEPIEKVLQAFKTTYNIQYTVNENTVIIK